MSVLETPANWSLEDARKQYEEDGATVLRGVVSPEWIQKLTVAANSLASGDAPSTVEFARPGEGRFFQDSFGWLRLEEYKNFLFDSNIAEAGSQEESPRGGSLPCWYFKKRFGAMFKNEKDNWPCWNIAKSMSNHRRGGTVWSAISPYIPSISGAVSSEKISVAQTEWSSYLAAT